MAFMPGEFQEQKPPKPPAGPVGQGYLTPFGETTPQLFQNVGNTLGGFGGGYSKSVYDSFMSNGANFFKPGKARTNMPQVPAWDGSDPKQYTDFWNKLVSSGSLSPQGLHFLLGLSRSPHNIPAPVPPRTPMPTFGI